MEKLVNAILDELLEPSGGSVLQPRTANSNKPPRSQAACYIRKLAATGQLKSKKVKKPSDNLKKLIKDQAKHRLHARLVASAARRKAAKKGDDISELFM